MRKPLFSNEIFPVKLEKRKMDCIDRDCLRCYNEIII